MTATRLSAAQLPQLVGKGLTGFIGWLSFEERSAKALVSIGKQKDLDVLMFCSTDNEYGWEGAEAIISAAMPKQKIIQRPVSRENHLTVFDTISKAVPVMLEKCNRVLIDVTSFPKEALMMLVYVLNTEKKVKNVSLIYNLASDYDTSEADPQKKWVSKGLKTVGSVIGFGGRMVPGRETTVIGMLGFDDDRFVRIVSALDADRVVFGIGRTPDKERDWMKKRNLHAAAQLRSQLRHVGDFEYNCDSIREVNEALRAIYEQYRGDNVVIVTLGNKIGVMGSAVFALRERDVQIAFGKALVYNEKSYSASSEMFLVFGAESVRPQ